MKVFIKKSTSKKSGNSYVAMYADFGWKVSALTFDKTLIQDYVSVYGQDFEIKVSQMVNDKAYTDVDFKNIK